MIEINLLPQELRKKEAPKLALPNVFNRRLAVALAGVFLAAHVLLGVAAAVQFVQWGHAKRQAESLRESTKEISRVKAEIKAQKERLDRTERMTRRKLSWAKLLNILSDSVPRGLWLRSFSVTEEMRATAAPKTASKTSPSAEQRVQLLKLEGSVVAGGQETAVIGRFIKTLKEDAAFAAVFGEVEFFNLTQRKIKSFDVYDFTIFCVFKQGILDAGA